MNNKLELAQRLQEAEDHAAAGEFVEARLECAEILKSDPHNPVALHTLGVVFSCEGDLQCAEQYLKNAVAGDPQRSTWFRNLGAVRVALGNWSAALDALARSLTLQPDNLGALGLQARALWESGETELALSAFEHCLTVKPDALEWLLGVTRCLLKLNRIEEAEIRVGCAIRQDPDCLEAHRLMAQVHFHLHRHEHALVHRLRVLRSRPDDPIAKALAAVAYYHCGETDKSTALFQDTLSSIPAELYATFLSVLLHQHGATAEILKAEHQAWAQRYQPKEQAPSFSCQALQGRRLRVAYLCGESAGSPLFRFLPPLLRHHDRAAFDVAFYFTESSLRGRYSQCGVTAAELKDVSGYTVHDIAQRIRRDRIDILVDCSGHYGGLCPIVLAMRAAPVQVSYPSYPSTTGISEVDYILTDRWTCPPGHEGQYTEQPCFLDAGYLTYDPPEAAPSVSPLPAERNGFVTFGVLQRPAKLNDFVWEAIADILQRTDNSHLIVQEGATDFSSNSPSRLRAVRALQSRGIATDRLRFNAFVPANRYMELFADIDIALDSFPYTGQTTTCDSLWMGIPVVTLAGTTHVSRVAAGFLTRVGLSRWVASDANEYVQIALRAAADLNQLAARRQGLRQRMLESSVLDGARFARQVEAAFRWMWHRRIDVPSARNFTHK